MKMGPTRVVWRLDRLTEQQTRLARSGGRMGSNDYYSTVRENSDGSTTQICVNIRPEARRAAEEGSGDSEELIKGCVWRLIYLKSESNEVKGDVVEFTIDEPTILELISDLREIRLAKKQVCRTTKAKS